MTVQAGLCWNSRRPVFLRRGSFNKFLRADNSSAVDSKKHDNFNTSMTNGFAHHYEYRPLSFLGVLEVIFMPPTLKKLEGHIAFGLSVCLSVCLCVCASVNF